MTEPSAHRWKQIEALFQALLTVPQPERAAALARACPDDPALREAVATLLRADEASDRFIEAAIGGEAAHVTSRGSRIGESVGAFRLVAELGRGGMGTVYRGERVDRQYRATVAVKFLRDGLADPEIQRRFLAERQILADLVHPNVARLLDGGTAADGTPYIVMELVDGQPLDAWCERKGLDVRARVRLFREVCVAVQHAHQQLVIHRDLKPTNILVTDDGVPKLLDFGIAKLLSAGPGSDQTTRLHAMTSSYASPEQVRGERVTTASDVYSLGVVLYRLLAGQPPYDLDGLSPGEVERRVCTIEPVRPSERAEGTAARELRGDLDNILMKALRKEPERRYGSVAELSEDLRRYLHREPVSARPDVLSYRVGRFVRRHPVGVGATALAMLLLVALATTSVVQARRASAERDRAEERQLTAERVSDFLVSLFEVADPNESNGDTITARQMLDQGAERILTALSDEPAIRASLAGVMGSVYRNLAALPQAEMLIDTALAIRRTVNGERSPEYAEALVAKAWLLYDQGDYEGAERLSRQAVDIRRMLFPPGHTKIGESLDVLGGTLDELNRLEESETVYRESLEIKRASLGPDHAETAASMTNLAGVLRSQSKHEEAIDLLRDALAIRRAVFGDLNLNTAHGLNHLSRTLSLAGRNEEALPIAQEGLAIRRRIHDGPHPEVAASLGNVAGILRLLGRFDEAETARRESFAMLRSVFGDEHPYVAATANSLADLLYRKDDLAGAEAAYREALRLHRTVLAPNNPNVGYPLTGLGRVLLDDGRPGEAEPYLREATELRRAGLPEGHWHVAASALPLGEALTALGRFQEAEPLLAEAVATLERQFGAADDRTRLARDGLAALFEATGRSELGASLRAAGR